VPSEPSFRVDLYRGTARFYDEFRLAYPGPLLDDLHMRAGTTGVGKLLDLACGTGQITFDLSPHFAEIWAVDQEPEAVEFGRAKARSLGVDNVRWFAGRAEDVDADRYFELVAIGNAFHRLQRQVIAESARRWLAPGGHLALLWSDAPWNGNLDWQRALGEAIRHWTRKAEATDRVPADIEQHLAAQPHKNILASAGFEIVGDFGFMTPHEWSVETLIGFMYATSFLSQQALGPHVPEFESDLRARLGDAEPEGVFREEISCGYTLAKSP
jgi:ubiquinone/menaquinone biosynthesis C-methylase UbiE